MADEDNGVVAAPGSALAGLRKAREKALASLTIDLLVPGLDPAVFVRYRPIKQRELDLANAAAAKSKDDDRLVVANAVVLSHACIGVFGTIDGQPDGDPSTWPRFDQQLAALLGIDRAEDGSPVQPTVTEIVRALYLTDGAVINTAEALNTWSAPAIAKREQELAGN